jgi:SnoaL-like polyketide cyclase
MAVVFSGNGRMVVRWKANGTCHGGFSGAFLDSVGRVITFMGMDTLRIVDRQLVEHWDNADGLFFVQQLGVREVPGRT